jgi:hypothetical protein
MMSLLVFAVLPLSLPAAQDAVDSVIPLAAVLANLSPLVPLALIVPTRPSLMPLDAAPQFLKPCAIKLLTLLLAHSPSVIFNLVTANLLVDVPSLLVPVKRLNARMDNVLSPTRLNPPLELAKPSYVKTTNGNPLITLLIALSPLVPTSV